MKKEIILCDRCGAEGAKTASVFINRQADGAGGMENNYEYIDLCHKCALVMLEKYAKHLLRTEKVEILREMRKKVQS